MERKWYKGDTHLHTTNSDGKLSKEQLIEYCRKQGLDFIIITDHNYNTIEQSYFDGGMLVIQGQELTDDNGHVNIWGPTPLKQGQIMKKLLKNAKQPGPQFH